MKTKILILAVALISSIGFAQKNEIKAAEKALKGGDSMAAKTSLESVAGMISGADEKIQAQYHFVRGKVYADLAKKGDSDAFQEALTSFEKAIEVEESSGKSKYTKDSSDQLELLYAHAVNAAVENYNNKDYDMATTNFHLGYKANPSDTLRLYQAASSAVYAGKFEKALEYYLELDKLGYDGSSVVYLATDVESGEVVPMEKSQRDLMVKAGTYKDPVDERSPSKRSEIVTNIAKIYAQLGRDDEAIAAFKAAREKNPNDVNLILAEANIYFEKKEMEKFKALMEEATQLAPDDPNLFYNIGTISLEQNNFEDARAALRKAIELKPDYSDAQLNLSLTYLNEGNALVNEMSELGTSKADIEKYEELKGQRNDLYKKSAEILEEALKISPDSKSVMEQLKNVYGALGDNDNFMRLKKMLGE